MTSDLSAVVLFSVSDTPDRATPENERIRNKKDFDDFHFQKQDKKMSYYRLRADFENTFQHGRNGRSCSLPRETSAINYGELTAYFPFIRICIRSAFKSKERQS